jgi:hypothetical protein
VDTPEDRLQQLADAYGVSDTFDDVADAIIAKKRPQLTYGENERRAVIALVALLVENAGTMSALALGDALPANVVALMTKLVASHFVDVPPATMPAETFVDLVIGDVRSVLNP